MNEKHLINIFNQLLKYSKQHFINTDKTILNAVRQREQGHKFNLSEHVKALIFAQLSSNTSWAKFDLNKQYIEKLFFYFDVDKIKNTNPSYFSDGLRQKKLGHLTIEEQMKSLKYNINILEKINNYNSSLDDFIINNEPRKVVTLLGSQNGRYKLKQVGIPLACEYIRNVGIDIVKPDRHIRRILGPSYLQIIPSDIDTEDVNLGIIDVCNYISKIVKLKPVIIDYLLWNYCATDYGAICTKNNPKCNVCVIKNYCTYKIQSQEDKNTNKSKVIYVLKRIEENVSVNQEETSNSDITHEIEEFFAEIPIGYEFSTGWFKRELSKKYNRPEGSYIPSDYSYNMSNKGINYATQTHYFIQVVRGRYKYVGKNYEFKGAIQVNPRKNN